MIIIFNDVYINTNSVKYIELINDPSPDLAIWDLNKQIESAKDPWWLPRTPMQDLFVKQLEQERDNYQQKFHVDIAFVDGSEMRESYPTQLERDVRFDELIKQLQK